MNPPTKPENEGPGSAWSRRRAAVRAEAEAERLALQQAEEEALAPKEPIETEEKTDAEWLAELELPDPDEMSAGADFAGFMKAGVPDRLRRRALRKLWLTNPALANLDELLDYGEDFSDGASLIENIQTAYQVGKGMMTHVEQMAADAGNETEAAGVAGRENDEIGNVAGSETLESGEDALPPEQNRSQTARRVSAGQSELDSAAAQLPSGADSETAGEIASLQDETVRDTALEELPLKRYKMRFEFED